MIAYLQRFVLTIFVMLAILPFWLLLRRSWKLKSACREAVLAAFVLFMTALVILTLDGKWASPAAMLQSAVERITSMKQINITPFSTIRGLVKYCSTEDILINLFGNVIMFIPWGFCLPLLWRRFRNPSLLLLCLGLTVCIECMQLFNCRYVDVDDVILNFLGGVLGAGIWWLVHRLFPQSDILSK